MSYPHPVSLFLKKGSKEKDNKKKGNPHSVYLATPKYLTKSEDRPGL